MKPESRKGPLAGIKVLDLASVIMGPVAAQHLADMGADVIKVEAPEGDLTRSIGPRKSADMGAVFITCNRNKRSIVLDLKQPRAREVLHRLVAGSDVLIHSVRTAPARKLGLDYGELRKLNERLVYCHVKGYSDDGAYAGQPAFDDTMQAESGLAMLQSVVAGEPRYVPSSIVDKICAIHAAYAILLALFEREHSGQGQEVELPMFETITAFNLTEHLWGEAFQPPLGSMGYDSVRRGVRKPYPTKDGYLAFLPYSDLHWHKFFRLVGRPELVDDERLSTFPARMKNYDLVFSFVRETLRERTTAEWVKLFGDQDIPMAAVNQIEDMLEHPHLKSVDFWQSMEHPTEGTLRVASNPIGLKRTPPSIRRLAPRLGEHTREVLREYEFRGDEVDGLLAEGVARQWQAGATV
ncbi:CoA transferase [Ramlibacter henchirensis]|uniref:CoA transferase n=1 Tax=Ramlibacter henchirensis TaxID=204072 RepID=A0A4Z0BV49_9BURK|nr:CoA transferase [Ramlibacter henchirensis]TFZ02721.1 CoA transferase [Ramlibacter henchirensis]